MYTLSALLWMPIVSYKLFKSEILFYQFPGSLCTGSCVRSSEWRQRYSLYHANCDVNMHFLHLSGWHEGRCLVSFIV